MSLSSSDQVNQFECVSRLKSNLLVFCPGDHFSISLYSDGTVPQLKFEDQICHGEVVRDFSRFAIDGQLHSRLRSRARLAMSILRTALTVAVPILSLLLQAACSTDVPVRRKLSPIDVRDDFEPAPVGSSVDPSLAAPGGQPAALATGKDTDWGLFVLSAERFETLVYREPNRRALRLGYLRLGGQVARDEQPVSGRGCRGFWFAVEPRGFVCTEDAGDGISSPRARAARGEFLRDKPLPYDYGFVSPGTLRYPKVPSLDEQPRVESVFPTALGSNDVPVDSKGRPQIGKPLENGHRLGPQLTLIELYGGRPNNEAVPLWFRSERTFGDSFIEGGEHSSSALVERVEGRTGASFVDAFEVKYTTGKREFAVTADLRIIEVDRIVPARGSTFHGLALNQRTSLPLAFVVGKSASGWRLFKGEDKVAAGAAVPHRVVVPMSGAVRFKANRRFYQTRRDPTVWLSAEDVAMVAAPPALPQEARRGEKWIDVSLTQQTLVLYEGEEPRYATLISTGSKGRGRAAGQKGAHRGRFPIRSKHLTASLVSEGSFGDPGGFRKNSGPNHSQRKPLPGDQGTAFAFQDAPWLQYFGGDRALFGAYWHDDFGNPRGSDAVQMSPIDAHYVFQWTEPSVPAGWHAVNARRGQARGTSIVLRQ